MKKVHSNRVLLCCIAAVLLGSTGIAIVSDEGLLSALRFFVLPSAFIVSQHMYACMGQGAGFGTAVVLSVPIMTVAATLRYFLWPGETESAVVYIGITGIVIGLLWGTVMPIFTAPYGDDLAR